MSFFGGEPFLNFKGIKRLLDASNDFCKENAIRLIADFTTNATLVAKSHIDYLKDFECHFQITLDGDRYMHNSIKNAVNSKGIDTYQKTLDALKMITDNISNRWIALRINFDNRTLLKIDEIIRDVEFLDRQTGYIILKKVWQVKTEEIDVNMLQSAIQKLFDNRFLVDYYIMPKGCVCFAERDRQVTVNYDGKVFKCTTISSFDDSNSLGSFDLSTGVIQWNENKMAQWTKDMTTQECKACKWFPSCWGPCNRQALAHKGEHICTFEAINLTNKEYMVYLFKYHLLRNQLTHSNTALS